jgi:hypothetical protein
MTMARMDALSGTGIRAAPESWVLDPHPTAPGGGGLGLRELFIGQRRDVRIPDVAVLSEVIVVQVAEGIGIHLATRF